MKKSSKLLLVILIIMELGVIMGYMITLAIKRSNHNQDDLDYIYHHKLELDYYRVKDNLVDLVDSVIHHYAPTSELHGIVLVDLCEEYKIDVRFVLAQGLIESHYGTKGLARKTNSVFNIYAYDSVDYDRLSKHGKFDHPDKSVRPYLKLLSECYLNNTRTEYDLMDNYVDLNGHRYASDKSYEIRLKQRYEEINIPQLDSTIDQIQMMRLRLNR